MSDIEYLDAERIKLWNALKEQKVLIDSINVSLSEVASRTPEDVAEAKQNTKRTSQYKNSTLKSFEIAEVKKNEIDSIVQELNKESEKLENIITEFNKIHSETVPKYEEIANIYERVIASNVKYERQVEEIAGTLDTCSTYITQAVDINTKLTAEEENCASLGKKIISLHHKTVEKYNKVKDLYDEIFGYDSENEETGETERVDGLKDELTKTYETLEKDFKNLNEVFKTLKNEKEKEFQKSIDDNQKKYDELHKKIESLLPGAMSAGLSSAYHSKRETEIQERNTSDKTFEKAIWALTVISLVPFGLGAYLLWGKGFDIQTIIQDMPRIAMATFPLYAPTLWVAYSSNRKSNLSKRLIEEYTHKEALSKTFEGLSNQIENLDDDKHSQKLKVKLLYAMVSMSSENPGALIKGYNKSDHPFMDIIDKSVNLTNSFQKLSSVPGIGGIANSLLGLIEPNQAQKIENGIKINESMNGNAQDNE